MKTPWHVWVIGLMTLVFNGGGAFDYVMTQTQNTEYLAQFSDLELAYFNGFPAWVVASWAIEVWGAVLGSVLLLARRRLAGVAFGVSMIAMFATMAHNFGLAELKMHHVVGPEAIWSSAIIAVVTVATCSYAIWMAQRGVLR